MHIRHSSMHMSMNIVSTRMKKSVMRRGILCWGRIRWKMGRKIVLCIAGGTLGKINI